MISVIIPVYNEESNVNILTEKLTKALSLIKTSYEIIYVNDASIDKTYDFLKIQAEQNKFIKVINFNRNYGQINHFFSYSIFGKWIGNLIKSFLLSKFALGCFFSSAQDANIFRFNKKNQLYLAHDRSDRAIKTLKKIICEINENNKFYKFLNLFFKSESSSHYSSNLLKYKNSFYKTCNYKENLFIIDGNMFPGKPSSQPNSFSIMAGAFSLIDQFLIKHKI